MQTHGCYIACFAMILSYFNNRPFYPDQMLDFLQRKGYVMSDARVQNRGLEDAAGFKLKFNYHEYPAPKVYAIRQVYFGPIGHWVLDSSTQVGMINDPFDGLVKSYKHYSYTGQVRYFMNK